VLAGGDIARAVPGTSVSDPHSLYADPDPGFQTNADPDCNPGLKLANIFQCENVFYVFIK
jgi:hypothetical protein